MNVEVSRRDLLRAGTATLAVCLAATGRRTVADDSQGGVDLDAWREGMRVQPVVEQANFHSIHSYFNTSPESPDGRWVLFYRSNLPEAHRGDVCIVERKTGRVKVLATNVTVEDAHRAACQQWVSGGKRVVFHDLRGTEWVVACIDIESGEEQVLATGRQIAWGQPHADLVPLYGPHWAPGDHRDLELLDVRTGQIRTVLTAVEVTSEYADWVTREFDDGEISLFFPILSSDMRRVLFKVSSPGGGGFRNAKDSTRKGIFCYDLAEKRFVYMSPSWGHPAWHPDSRRILNITSQGLIVVDGDTGKATAHPKLPPFSGGHPCFSPDGRLFATDTKLEAFGGERGQWGVVVGDLAGGQYEFLHRFDNSQGATSWRRSHPHPAFSPDGRRIYFNVSDGTWTRLLVAECDGR